MRGEEGKRGSWGEGKMGIEGERRRGERRRGEDGERGRGEDGEREEGEEARRERRQAASACSLTLPSGSKDTEEAQALEETQGKIIETWVLESGVVKF